MEELASHGQQLVERPTEKGRRPAAGGYDDPVCEDRALGGFDPDMARLGNDRLDRDARLDARAERFGLLQLNRDAPFGRDVATAWLVTGTLGPAQPFKGGETRGDLMSGENLVRDVVITRGRDRPTDEIGLAVMRRQSRPRSHDKRAAGGEKPLARRRLQLSPDPVRSLDQGHIVGSFTDRLPRNARLAVAGSAGVRWGKSIEANCADAATGKLVERRAAYRSQPDHDHVGPGLCLHASVSVKLASRMQRKFLAVDASSRIGTINTRLIPRSRLEPTKTIAVTIC